MPIAIQPDDVVAGGFIEAGNTWVLLHSQIPGGNAVGKRRAVVEFIQEQLDVRQDISTIPIEDPDHPDYVQGVHGDDPPSNLPVYDDYYDVIDDGTTVQVTITDRMFIYDKGSTTEVVGRTWVTFVELTLENDQSLGGEDRYMLGWTRTA